MSFNESEEAAVRWKQDIDLIHKGMKELLTNDFSTSEKTFEQGMNCSPPDRSIPDARDIRGVFAMLQALVSAAEGVISMSDDQLSLCYTKLLEADKLAQSGADWLGKKAIRGLCLISIGLLELIERKYLKAVANIAKSYKYIKILHEKGLDYSGKEAEIVRSTALYTFGIYYVANSLLPKSNTSKLATWISGFKGDRKKGEEMILQCFQEKGVCAAWAANAFIVFNVNTKTFLGLGMSDEDRAHVNEMFAWAQEEYPGSLFFDLAKISYFSYQRKVDEALALAESVEDYGIYSKPVLKWSLWHNKLLVHLSRLEWKEGAAVAEKSLQVFIDSGRRTMGPSVAAQVLLCLLVHEEETGEKNEEGREKLIEVINTWVESRKEKWVRQDRYGFRLFRKYLVDEKKLDEVSFKKKSKENRVETIKWALLDLCVYLVNVVRTTWYMKEEDLRELRRRLLDGMKQREGDLSVFDRVRCYMCLIEFSKQIKEFEEALSYGNLGLDLEEEMQKKEKQEGIVQVILYYMAIVCLECGRVIESRDYYERIKDTGSGYKTYPMLFFKLVVLEQMLENGVTEIKIPARKNRKVLIELNSDSEKEIRWSWWVKDYNVGFVTLNEGEEIPKDLEKKEKGEGKTLGRKVCLYFDNSFSMLRAKNVHLKLISSECTLTIAE
eukprot:augustus_masked-scaffold_52-processed-gene-0.42-mRNA-1 protein AED:0.15 eAED:0.15 QI:0/-1/0/1/-1/1/1/0/664